jgi:hypothetical protein
VGSNFISIAASNRHPVDELAHVREKIAILKERERELRRLILDGSCGLVGEQYQASVTTSLSRKIDPNLLRDLLSDEAFALVSKPAQTINVKTSRKHELFAQGNATISFPGSFPGADVRART